MSHEASWILPGARVPSEHLHRAVATRSGGGRVTLTGAAEDRLLVEVELLHDTRAFVGAIELYFGIPTGLDTLLWDRDRVESTITFDEINSISYDDEPELDHDVVPREFHALVEPEVDAVTILGNARGQIRLFPESGFAKVEIIARADDVEGGDGPWHAALLGKRTRGGTSWAYGWPGLLMKTRAGGAWTRVETGIDRAHYFADVHPASEQRCWLITDTAQLWLCEDGRPARRVEGIPGSDEGRGGLDNRWSIAARGEELWVADGTSTIYCVDGGGMIRRTSVRDAVEQVCVASDGLLWLRGRSEIHVGDGTRFELRYEGEEETSLRTMAVGANGQVFVALGEDHGWRNHRVLTCESTRVVDTELELNTGAWVTDLAFARGNVLWMATTDTDQVVRVALPGAPHTRMTVRSSRNDNGAEGCWDLMVALAESVATELGGWRDAPG